MNSTVRNAPQTLMFASPRPVDPAALTELSQYCPAPTIGESPVRPGSFHASPLVVVTEDMSPAAVTAFMLMVRIVNFTGGGSSNDKAVARGGSDLSTESSSRL